MSKRVWEVCEPHPDVFARDIDPSMFAASLHAVETGTADRDYTDPERFFNKTYLTRSLESVLEGVWARLIGDPGSGAPVLRLETPFGGGKTHTMVALYHLAKSPKAVEATEVGEKLRNRLNLRHLPQGIRVAVLDGVALDVLGRQVNGLTIHTLWGELAYRLGGREFYEKVRDADSARTPPGQAKLAEMLRQAQPVLILMDEVMHYLAKAQTVKVGDSNLSAQTIAFLRELTAAVNETDKAVLVLSLPASSLEVPAEDPPQVEEMFQRVRKVLGRTELIETPVSQDEVFGVLQRRLFRSVGNKQQAKRAVDAFCDYYAEYARFFPEKLRSPDYRERMMNAYPFHPELIDLLYQRWGPHPQFQRTRGALRLLALVLRRLWNQRPGSAYLIQPHHIDLADRYIKAEVVRLLDSAFETITTGDILNRAREIDRELGGDYQREELSKGAATCALLYSISPGRELLGLTEEELRVALLRPNINPAQVSEVLGRLRNQLWYLRCRDQRYFFMSKPNLNKVILDYEQGIAEEKVDEKITESLRAISGVSESALHVLVAPATEEAVGEPSKATLVVLPLHLSDPQQWMKRIVDKTTRRNLLIFLAPEKEGEGRLRAAVKRLLALEAIQKAPIFRELDKEDQNEVRDRFKEKQEEVEGLLFSLYSRVFRPDPEGVQEIQVTLKRDAKTLAKAVESALKEKGILIESISPDYLEEMLKKMGFEERPVTIVEIETVLTGSPDQPVVIDPRKAIQQAVREGGSQGKWYLIANGKTFEGTVPDDVPTKPDAKIAPAGPKREPTEQGQETEPETLTRSKRAVHLQIETSGKNLYPLRKVLESLQDTGVQITAKIAIETSGKNLHPLRQVLEPLQSTGVQITVKIKDEDGDLAKKRDDLKKLLDDYGVTHTWSEGELSED